MLRHASDMFKEPPKSIYYCFTVDQQLFSEMKNVIQNIEFHEGLPSKSELESWAMQEPGHKILILDDMLQQASKSGDIVDLYCQYSHHLNFTSWLLCQKRVYRY